MIHPLQLLQLFGERLCHDFATPLGAISLGLEMLQPELQHHEGLPLLTQSFEVAAHRLVLWRCLFSASRPIFEEALPCLKQSWKRITLQHNPELLLLQGPLAQLTLSLLFLAQEVLPRGGEITVKALPEGIQIVFRGTINETVPAALTVNQLPQKASFAPICYAQLIAQSVGIHVEVHQSTPTCLQITATT